MYYLLKWIKFSVKEIKHLKNTGKKLEKSGNSQEFCQPGKVGTMIEWNSVRLGGPTHGIVTKTV